MSEPWDDTTHKLVKLDDGEYMVIEIKQTQRKPYPRELAYLSEIQRLNEEIAVLRAELEMRKERVGW